MVSDRNQMKRRAQFVTRSAPEFNTDKAFVKQQQEEETIEEEHVQKEQTETPTNNDLTATSFVPTVLEGRLEEEQPIPEEQSQIFHTPGASMTEDLVSMESLTERTNRVKVAYFGVGALVAIVLATIAALYCRRRRRRSWKRQRQIKTIGPWASKNLHFHDEGDSTNDDFDSLEAGSNTRYRYPPNRPIDERGPSDHLRADDWLGGVGFDKNDKSRFAENDDRDTDADSVSDSSECSEDDESDTSFCELLSGDSSTLHGASLLNGDSSNSKHSSLSLDSPPRSPLRLSPEPELSPPTVSELFQNNLSALLNLSTNNNSSSYERLQKKQEDLNKSLFLLSDQFLEQQRELEASGKALSEKMTRRKRRDLTYHYENIEDGIELLESEKDRIDEKLKKVRLEIKSYRMERRRKL